jgi:hypothetical protein
VAQYPFHFMNVPRGTMSFPPKPLVRVTISMPPALYLQTQLFLSLALFWLEVCQGVLHRLGRVVHSLPALPGGGAPDTLA